MEENPEDALEELEETMQASEEEDIWINTMQEETIGRT